MIREAMTLFEFVAPNKIGPRRTQAMLRYLCARMNTDSVIRRTARQVDGGMILDEGKIQLVFQPDGDTIRVTATASEDVDETAVQAARRFESHVTDLFGQPVIAYGRRVFCIGYQRTGTRSLSAALRGLGLFEVHYAGWLRDAVSRGDFSDSMFDDFEAFADNPFPSVFRALDRKFPGSLFILTVRDTASWLPSAEMLHQRTHQSPGWQWLYGIPHYDAAIFRERYERHNADVIEHFGERRSDLLVVDLTKGTGWAPICSFLSLPVPERPFPHRNKRG